MEKLHKVKILCLMMSLILLFPMVTFNNAEGNTILSENFESSAVGSIPSGWNVLYGGQTIAVSDATSFDGTHSLFMQAQPFWGADLLTNIPMLTSGIYEASFLMKVDTASWTGTDGAIAPLISINGNHSAQMRVAKYSGLYYLEYWGTNVNSNPFPISVDINSWLSYKMIINLDTDMVNFYFNNSYLGSDTPAASVHSNVIALMAGDAGQGGGHPAVYYDSINLSSVSSVPEPATMLLLGLGLMGLARIRRKLSYSKRPK